MSQTNIKNGLLFLQFLISSVSIFGSLFFSEVMKFPPCDLCWYQRILIYPIALIVLTGFYLESREINKFITPFVFLGVLVSGYHNLIYYKFIEVIVPCSASAPCTQQQLNYLGFVTIPLLSFVAFVTLLLLNLTVILIEFKKDTYEK